MGFTDAMNYVLFKNPVSQTMIDSVKTVGGYAFSKNSNGALPAAVAKPELPPELRSLAVRRIVMMGSPYVRFAGLSGAAAVLLGAYGAHSLMLQPGLEDRKRVYTTANHYHFIHSLALFGVPLSRHPKTAFVLFVSGMTLFCGTCYYDAFTGDTRFRRYTPMGGTLLVLAWLSLIL